ncbi:TPA: hypothetical protein MIX26_33475, partial [Klebsiella pneumoniae]|nr:hypothetical protein [Klebsiella pneumoniae]
MAPLFLRQRAEICIAGHHNKKMNNRDIAFVRKTVYQTLEFFVQHEFFATSHAYWRAPHVLIAFKPSISACGYRLMVPVFQFNNDH